MENPLAPRGVHHAHNFAAATGLPEDHHVPRVTAEGRDVVAYPLERCHQIGGAGVTRGGVLRTVRREIERAENIEAVVDADHHHVPELTEAAPVVGVGLHRGSVGETATVETHHELYTGRRGPV